MILHRTDRDLCVTWNSFTTYSSLSFEMVTSPDIIHVWLWNLETWTATKHYEQALFDLFLHYTQKCFKRICVSINMLQIINQYSIMHCAEPYPTVWCKDDDDNDDEPTSFLVNGLRGTNVDSFDSCWERFSLHFHSSFLKWWFKRSYKKIYFSECIKSSMFLFQFLNT